MPSSEPSPLVVQVVPYYPPHLGGMEAVAHAIAEALAGHRRVEVLTSRSGSGSAPKVERRPNLVIRRLLTLELAHLPYMPGLLLRLLRLPRDAVVHVHIAQAYIPEMVWLSCRLRRRPYIAHYHLDVEPSGLLGPIFVAYKRWILGGVLRGAARVVVVAADQPEILGRKYAVPAERITFMPNGVGDEFFCDPQGRPGHDGLFRLLFVGRLAPQKDVPLLLRAVAAMTEPAELVIVGDGEERAMLEQLAGDLGLSRVRFVGAQRGGELLAWYRWADALVLTSEKEGTSLVLLEAMASGLAIVATEVEGVIQSVGDSGLLVRPEPEAFAKAVDSVVADPALARDLAGRSYRRAQQFPWSALMVTLEQLYEDVAAGR